MSCLYKIKEASNSLTPTERKIAEFILNNPTTVVEESSQRLAIISNTSAAAWIRFSKKIGYKGLTAMKVSLAKDEPQDDDILNDLIEEDSIDILIKKVQQVSIKSIHQTYKLLDKHSLQSAIDHLLNSNNIYLIGVGGSGIICTDFMYKLLRINKNIIYFEDPHVLLSSIAHIQSTDVLLAISYNGETQLVNAAAKKAKKASAPVIAITKYNVKSTLSKLANIKLYTPVEEKEFHLGSISNRNSALILTDLIYYGIAKKDIDKTKQNLIKTRDFINEIDIK